MNEYMMNLATSPVGQEFTQRLLTSIGKISETPNGRPFAEPVDYVGLGLTDYLQLVKRPMDFKTISKNLQNHEYQFLYELLHDLALIFKNASIYNREDQDFIYTIHVIEQEVKETLQRIDHRITPELYHIIGNADVTQFMKRQDNSPVTLGRFQLTLIKLKKLPERIASQCVYALCAARGEVDGIHTAFRVLRPSNYTSEQLRMFEQCVADAYREHIASKRAPRQQR